MVTDVAKLPPQNIEAEQQVLGAILFDPDALLIAADIITAADFYKQSHAEIFNSCLDVYQDSGTFDIISVIERLRAKGTLEQVGGIAYLSQLAAITPTAANIRHHAEIVKEKSMLRRLLKWSNSIQDKATTADNLRALFCDIESELIQIADSIEEKHSPHINHILASIRHRWQAISADDHSSYVPLNNSLSKAIPYFMPCHFWAIGGYTSVGKSTFLAQLLVDTCEQGAKNLVFSLEDSREDKVIKLIANIIDCTQKRLMLGHTQGIEDKILQAEEKLRKWNPIIYDDVYSVDEMRLKIKKHKLRDGLNIVWIDYIQNVQGHGDIYERLSKAVTTLQKIAKEMHVTIVMLSQVTNESMKANTELIGLKGAGELAAAPDIILWLKRIKGEGRERFLDVEIRKNRPFGETGKIEMVFSESWARIYKRGA